MSWLKKSQFVYHAYFSFSHAIARGFHTYEAPNGKEVDLTEIRKFDDFKDLPDDAIYVGDVLGGAVGTAMENYNENRMPKINGKLLENSQYSEDIEKNISPY